MADAEFIRRFIADRVQFLGHTGPIWLGGGHSGSQAVHNVGGADGQVWGHHVGLATAPNHMRRANLDLRHDNPTVWALFFLVVFAMTTACMVSIRVVYRRRGWSCALFLNVLLLCCAVIPGMVHAAFIMCLDDAPPDYRDPHIKHRNYDIEAPPMPPLGLTDREIAILEKVHLGGKKKKYDRVEDFFRENPWERKYLHGLNGEPDPFKNFNPKEATDMFLGEDQYDSLDKGASYQNNTQNTPTSCQTSSNAELDRGRRFPPWRGEETQENEASTKSRLEKRNAWPEPKFDLDKFKRVLEADVAC